MLSGPKSLITTKELRAGELIKVGDIWSKRPYTGIPSKNYYKIIGRKLKKNLEKNKILKVFRFEINMKLLFFTGSRSEWGYIRPILKICKKNKINYEICATNMHLLDSFGILSKKLKRMDLKLRKKSIWHWMVITISQ